MYRSHKKLSDKYINKQRFIIDIYVLSLLSAVFIVGIILITYGCNIGDIQASVAGIILLILAIPTIIWMIFCISCKNNK